MAQYQAGIQTKNNIYFSSEKLFYENGYANTSVTNITDYAKANRGSFYHHYKNKLELGVKVYTNFANRNAKIQELFGDGISEPIRVLLSLKTYWYLFYRDEKIRRFAIDLANENILQIKDNAKGIPTKLLDKIFLQHFTTKSKIGGTGIGLFMVKEIIEKHMDATISVSNEEFTFNDKNYKGACFTITF